MIYTLDIGCGNNKHKGKEYIGELQYERVIGLDIADLPSVDVVHNMEEFPYPFSNETFDNVVMHHSLEHVSKENNKNIKIIEEIHRLLKPDGILIVDVPIGHWFTYDPTHKNYVGFWYWKYFSTDFPLNYYTTARFKLMECKLIKITCFEKISPIFKQIYKMSPTMAERIIGFLHLDAEVQYTLKKE
jgi:SAM-dependent methyltransferase